MRSRILAAISAATISALALATPAHAQIGLEGDALCLTPSQTTLWAAKVDLASDNFGIADGVWEVPEATPEFAGGSTAFDIDPHTNIGYFIEIDSHALWSVDIENETYENLGPVSRADFATFDVYDLAYAPDTDTWYALMWNVDDQVSEVGTLNFYTGDITPIGGFYDGQSDHTMDGLAYYDGALWAVESMGDGSAPWVVRYDTELGQPNPDYGWLGRLQNDATYVVSADISADGILYVLTYDEGLDEYYFEALDVTDSANVSRVDAITVSDWGIDCGIVVRDPMITADDNSGDLASTGVDASGIALAGAALVAAGAVVAVRRRARR